MKGPQLIVLSVYDPGVRTYYEYLACSLCLLFRFFFSELRVFFFLCMCDFFVFSALELHAHLDGQTPNVRPFFRNTRASLAMELERVFVRRLVLQRGGSRLGWLLRDKS